MQIPKQEQIMITYVFDGAACYVATKNTIGKYVLYKIIDNDYRKMQMAISPLDFDKLIERDRSN